MDLRVSDVRKFYLSAFLGILVLLGSGCISIKTNKPTAILPKTNNATQQQLMDEVNRFAKVASMRAKVRLQFEDNSFAEFGSKELYRSADGEIVVQRPAKIRFSVKVPVLGTDVAQMTSDGDHFRVAILQDGGSGKYKAFVRGTNEADYTKLQRDLRNEEQVNTNETAQKSVNAFASLRPQHFTDAMLVRPTDPAYIYTQSTIYEMDEDKTDAKKSPIRRIMRGYYLLDEYKQDGETLKINRRFWFNRVGGIILSRQQIFDKEGEIESDIVYGNPIQLSEDATYSNMPGAITVTRPKEKYAMSISYPAPQSVTIGKTFPDEAFILDNTWGLKEVDLDDPYNSAAKPAASPQPSNSNSFRQ